MENKNLAENGKLTVPEFADFVYEEAQKILNKPSDAFVFIAVDSNGSDRILVRSEGSPSVLVDVLGSIIEDEEGRELGKMMRMAVNAIATRKTLAETNIKFNNPGQEIGNIDRPMKIREHFIEIAKLNGEDKERVLWALACDHVGHETPTIAVMEGKYKNLVLAFTAWLLGNPKESGVILDAVKIYETMIKEGAADSNRPYQITEEDRDD